MISFRPKPGSLASVLVVVALVAAGLALARSDRDRRAARASAEKVSAALLRAEEAWLARNGAVRDVTTLVLRGGDCLDLGRVEPPWSAGPVWTAPGSSPRANAVEISADARAAGIRPYERDGFDRAFDGRPHDGAVHAVVSGWSHPPPEVTRYWPVAPPAQIEANIRSGLVRPIRLWEEGAGWEAFALGRGATYVDARRLSQCRDYGHTIRCWVISPDQQYAYWVALDGVERRTLPASLAKVSSAIEATRGRCPPALGGRAAP